MPLISTFGALSSRGFGGIGGGSNPIYSFLGMLGYKSPNGPSDIIADSNGDIIVLNQTLKNISKISIDSTTFGTTIWSKDFTYKTIGMAIDSSNNIYLGGSTQITGLDNGTAKVMKLDTNGNLLWSKNYSGFRLIPNLIFGTNYSQVAQISINDSGTIYIGDDSYYANIDSDGIVISSRNVSYPESRTTNNIWAGSFRGFPDVDIQYVNFSTNTTSVYYLATTGLLNIGGTIWSYNSEPAYSYTITNTDSLVMGYRVNWSYNSGPVQPNFTGCAIRTLNNTYIKRWYSFTDIYTCPECVVDNDGTIYFTTVKIASGGSTELYIGALTSTGTDIWLNKMTNSTGTMGGIGKIVIKNDKLYLYSSTTFLVIPKNGGVYGLGIYTLSGGLTYNYTSGVTLPYTTTADVGGALATGTPYGLPNTQTNTASTLTQTLSSGTSLYEIAVTT